MEIYTRIRNTREDRDIQQKEICEALDIVQQQYSKYERGINEIPTRYIVKLSQFFNVSADYLLCLIDEPRPLYPDNSEKGRGA